MDEDWGNAIGSLICKEICDGAGAGICDSAPFMRTDFLCISVLRVASGPWVKLASCKSA